MRYFSPCPWCGEKVEINLGVVNSGDDTACTNCGKLCEVESDYVGNDSWGFWLIESSEQIRIDREREGH